MSNQVYWHWPTFLMFICMGLVLTWAYNSEKRRSCATGREMRTFCLPYNAFYFLWLMVGTFRLVDDYHGGTDTPNYIDNFVNIFNPSYSDGIDLAFKLLNMAVRSITSDYHLFIFIVYSIMLYAYVKFTNSYSLRWTSSVPLFLISYLYFVGFSSMRSNLAFCYLLIALAYYVKKQYKPTILFAICSCLTHVSLFMYAPVLIFCYMLRDLKVKRIHIALAFVASLSFGLILQQTFISGAFAFLDNVGSGAYTAYATKSLNQSFSSFYVVSFPSIMIGVVLTILLNDINKVIMKLPESQSRIVKTLLLICLYDVILVPITFSLGVYRGYMYLMVARILMWGILIKIIGKKYRLPNLLVNVTFFSVFLIWIYTRFEAMHESSQLMPYVFNFF